MRLRRDATGQVAMEYLIVFSMTFFMIIPLIIIFAVQSNNMRTDIAAVQLNKLTSEIVDAAEKVYYLGEPSQEVLKVTFPQGIDYIVVDSNSLVFYMYGDGYEYIHYEDTLVNLTGKLSSNYGTRYVKVVALGDEVLIVDE